MPRDLDDEAMQAECVVRALDAYLASLALAAPSVYAAGCDPTAQAARRALLVDTLAASFRMTEKRKSALQQS